MKKEDKVKRLSELLLQKQKLEREHKLETIFPKSGPFRRELFPKHIEFANSTKTHRISVFMASNRSGKTYDAAAIIAQWAQGIYMDWFDGRKYNKPLRILCAGKTHQSVRDVWCTYLLGQGLDGTGFIKKENVAKVGAKSGIAGFPDYVLIRNHFGGNSIIYFRSYDQSVDSFMGYTLDVAAFDEEPPSHFLYTEVLTRIATSKGNMIMTYTPLGGMSDVTMQIMDDQKKPEDKRNIKVVNCTWDDIPESLLDSEMKTLLKSQYSPYEIDARTKGLPSAGKGMCYPLPDEDIMINPFKIPDEWPRFMGFDYGFRRTAAVYIAMDPNTKVCYLYDSLLIRDATPADHFMAMKQKGSLWIPGASETALTMDSGQSRLEFYQEMGLNLYPASVAKRDLWASIDVVWQFLLGGQLKVFSTETEWFREKNGYHRTEKNKICDLAHDLQDATRYAMVDGIKYATTHPDYTPYEHITHAMVDAGFGCNPITGY